MSRLPPTIGRYRVVGQLGRGAMGIVYSAYDDLMDRPVAIKVMMADVQDDPETSARFYREAHAAGQLVHRNIITIFDLGDEDGRPYIVMELLEGKTLSDFIRRPEGVRIEQKIALMLQLCEGLQLAHGKGIFHRDIKPGNLLISNEGGLKILDFGIARLASSSMTVTGLIVGTPDYMSPEQACGKDVDERSDIFSVGAVCYFMLTGRKPFAASDLSKVLDKVQKEDPLPIRDAEAPPALVAVVTRALAKSADARYQNVSAMWAHLLRVERELAAEARRMSEEVRAELETFAALDAERKALCERLQVVPTAIDVARFRQDLLEQSGAVAAFLEGGIGDSWDWATAREHRRQVAEFRNVLDADVSRLRKGATDLEDGIQAARAGDLSRALTCLESAVQLMPSSERARNERIGVLVLLGEQRAAEDRARALLGEAQAAATRAEWATVVELTRQVLEIDKSSAGALALRDRATTAMATDARNRQQQCEKALERAEKAARKGRYDEADQAIADARRLDPESPAVPVLAARVRKARLDAERASALERQSSERIADAHDRFDRGERSEALEDLRNFLAREPLAPGVSAALARMTADADRIVLDERRRAEAAELAQTANAALNADDPERALVLARQALATGVQDPLARTVEGTAAARVRERALARERDETAARAVQRARELLASGKFAAAREQARRAASLKPQDPESTALLDTVAKEEAKAQEAAARAEEARQRARATAPILVQARAAEANRDYVRASWLAETALALDVDCAEAVQILERLSAKILAQPTLADETVKLGQTVATSDADDTLTLNPTSRWDRLAGTVRRLADPLRERLAGFEHVWRSRPKPPKRD